MRAAWQAFEAAQLPLLRMEKPGLKQSQYRDMLWKQARQGGRGGLGGGQEAQAPGCGVHLQVGRAAAKALAPLRACPPPSTHSLPRAQWQKSPDNPLNQAAAKR